MKKKILQLLCALGTLLALSASAGACVIFSYQPQVPNELVKK
ncbi:MAG: cyclic lactone autoinducer peptide [Firmicutes bacterium]|nr:cyclic lactone autoinducer peptide [Bacillota bacterium]